MSATIVPLTPRPTPQPVRRISLVETAKLVRHALKAAYPTIKFSVRVDRYSMGSSIDVTWTDGPTHAMVQPLLQQCHGSHFDGMIDLKSAITQEYQGETVQYEGDFVSGQRNISTAFMTQIACKVAHQYGVAVPSVATSGGDHGYVPSSPEASVRIPDAPPFNRDECL